MLNRTDARVDGASTPKDLQRRALRCQTPGYGGSAAPGRLSLTDEDAWQKRRRSYKSSRLLACAAQVCEAFLRAGSESNKKQGPKFLRRFLGRENGT